MTVFLSHSPQHCHWYVIVHTAERALISPWQKMRTGPVISEEYPAMEIDGEYAGFPILFFFEKKTDILN